MIATGVKEGMSYKLSYIIQLLYKDDGTGCEAVNYLFEKDFYEECGDEV